MLKEPTSAWSIQESEALYAIGRWGGDFLSISDDGLLHIHPTLEADRSLPLLGLVERLQDSGAGLPLLIRFNDLIESRMREISGAFQTAIQDREFQGQYRCIFPIKVNQQRQVVERILQLSKQHGFGLEVGSKPELIAGLAITDNDTPLVANGFKDRRFIETAVMAMKMGRQLTVVVEKYTELEQLIDFARTHDVRPNIGMRVKLAARGAGRWQASGGYRSKFGLTVGEILKGLAALRELGLHDCFQMLHFHLGSQIPDIQHIKAALIEASHIYVELVGAGAGLTTIDVGGGLGVDYDGTQTSADSSVNYTLQEYANDVVFHVQQVCDAAKIPHPNIFSESGRAVVAHHSVLVVNVLGVASQAFIGGERPQVILDDNTPLPLRNLHDTLDDLRLENLVESFHDAKQSLDIAMTLFGVGHLRLSQRSDAERLFWRICQRIQDLVLELEEIPEELRELDTLLTDTYFCNFSLFQSLPDSWAIDQLFPVTPIHRLHEKPTQRAVLGDITCDSDGKICRFIDGADPQGTLPLHRYGSGTPYYLAMFLVGAYQETLGDLHNLFGDTNAAHVSLLDDGEVEIDAIVKGDTVAEVLGYVQFSSERLSERMQISLGQAVRSGRLLRGEANRLLQLFESGLTDYTYLGESESE